MTGAGISADGTIVYSYNRVVADLYLVNGWKRVPPLEKRDNSACETVSRAKLQKSEEKRLILQGNEPALFES